MARSKGQERSWGFASLRIVCHSVCFLESEASTLGIRRCGEGGGEPTETLVAFSSAFAF
jgi:hypothetical protein